MGSDFWKGLVDWVKTTLVDEKVISPEDLNLIQVIDEPQGVVDAIFAHYANRSFLPNPDEGAGDVAMKIVLSMMACALMFASAESNAQSAEARKAKGTGVIDKVLPPPVVKEYQPKVTAKGDAVVRMARKLRRRSPSAKGRYDHRGIPPGWQSSTSSASPPDPVPRTSHRRKRRRQVHACGRPGCETQRAHVGAVYLVSGAGWCIHTGQQR